MLNKMCSIFLSMLLVLSVIMPSIVDLLDIKIETSILNDLEEENQKRNKQELEFKDFFSNKNETTFFSCNKQNILSFKRFFINPSTNCIEVTTPPPEFLA